MHSGCLFGKVFSEPTIEPSPRVRYYAMGSSSSRERVDDASILKQLNAVGQAHLVSGWTPDTPPADKQRFFQQVKQLEGAYPGGLRSYVGNARKLLADSKAGLNPLEGWSPSVPAGEWLSFAESEFLEHEKVGLRELDGCSFVLVAGGLGERLGFSGIKVALPWQITSGQTYLELYIRSILAMQQAATVATGRRVQLPLAIMVSDDTAERTDVLLKENDNFGMAPGQVTLLKQEKVPCLSDNEARLALDPKDPYQIMTKPHGHGDVHYLLHSSGTLGKWRKGGVRWVYFFQDTNALAFKVLPAAIGVSTRLKLQVNSVCVPRTPGESIGGLMRLTHQSGKAQTANVEYNQIDALLKATVEPRGDVAGPGPDGFSPYPGSINQLLFSLGPYEAKLRKTGGTMPEFVNPKYTDSSKTTFKSPTRLECMMQDYPKSLDASANVGYTIVTGTTTFSPVKTNLADARVKSKDGMPTYSAASGEADAYASGCEMLVAAGVQLPAAPMVTMSGVRVSIGARVVIDPSFGVGVAAWRGKLSTPGAVNITNRSTLLMHGDLSGLRIEELSLDGSLVVRLCPGAKVVLRRVYVSNAGWSFKNLSDSQDEALTIRGYELAQHGQRELIFDTPGEYVVEDEKPESCNVA